MEKNLKKGDWLFTCAMKPKQFSHYTENNPDDYSPDEMTNEFLDWCKFDDFTTLEGSNHSQKHCSCSPISEKYAKWFIENELDKLYDPQEPDEEKWENYERRVKELCIEVGIEFEGI